MTCKQSFTKAGRVMQTNKKKVKVGDTVTYRVGFSKTPVKTSIVKGLVVTKDSRRQDGYKVVECETELVHQNRVFFILGDGDKVYSEQVVEI